MIEAVHGKGVNRAKVTCDECGRTEVLTCDYLRRSEGSTPNVGQIHKRLVSQNWEVRRSDLYCPTCAARKRAFGKHQDTEGRDMQKISGKEKAPVRTTPSEAPPREPGYRMIGMICDMLNLTYDRARKGYINPADNDRTVADAIGEGCMWGWVARIREAECGPDKRWAEIDAIRAEMLAAVREANDRTAAVAESVTAQMNEISRGADSLIEKIGSDLAKRIEALNKRVNALDPEIGPRAGKVRA